MNIIQAINNKNKQREEYKQKLLDEIYNDVQRISKDFNFSHAYAYSREVLTLTQMRKMISESLRRNND